jgi:hypothetical protein
LAGLAARAVRALAGRAHSPSCMAFLCKPRPIPIGASPPVCLAAPPVPGRPRRSLCLGVGRMRRRRRGFRLVGGRRGRGIATPCNSLGHDRSNGHGQRGKQLAEHRNSRQRSSISERQANVPEWHQARRFPSEDRRSRSILLVRGEQTGAPAASKTRKTAVTQKYYFLSPILLLSDLCGHG